MPAPVARACPDNSPRPAGLSYRFAFFSLLDAASRARRAAVTRHASVSAALATRILSATMAETELAVLIRIPTFSMSGFAPPHASSSMRPTARLALRAISSGTRTWGVIVSSDWITLSSVIVFMKAQTSRLS